MNKKIFGVFVSVLAVVMLTLPMSMVFAKNNPKFIYVSGELTALGTTPVFTPAGKSEQVKLWIPQNTLVWAGSFEDSVSIADGRWMLHARGAKLATAWNIHELQAEFMGLSGTLTIITSQGQWRIIAGTGDFANCHGQGITWPIVVPAFFGYEGVIHFDP